MLTFNAHDWYWFVGSDHVNVYGSRRNIYVALDDADYLAWTAGGVNAGPIGAEAEIWPYVQDIYPQWMFDGTTFAQPAEGEYTKTQLNRYSLDARIRKENGGIVVDAIPVRTDTAGVQNVMLANLSSSSAPAGQFPIIGADDKVYLINQQTIEDVASAVVMHFTDCAQTYVDLQPQIESGAVTTLEQIDDAYAW